MIINNLVVEGENIDRYAGGATYIDKGVTNSDLDDVAIS
jgi:hypothetical protein